MCSTYMGRCSRILRRSTSPSMTQMSIPAKPTTKANHQRQDKVRNEMDPSHLCHD
ncbi:hypothetical protein QWZ13_00460 [Reinekea marina]|uniref:hypothetical protein n=1 Tax=Reinekea marina TaxID=1310421 RepID=UPI0025B2B9D1|nr:hypothetical protein [Reinekea marina]MDN3647374.1 hypothetical protein [Reinekea marina]